MAIPHLAVPFQLAGDGTALTVVQDSIDDITQCVEVLCVTTIGQRVELPGYGVPDQTFAQGAPATDPIVTAVASWEPRARVAVTASSGLNPAVQVTVAPA